MYEFFGGTTRILTPDNLKVGILSNRKYEDPVINSSFRNWQTTIIQRYSPPGCLLREIKQM